MPTRADAQDPQTFAFQMPKPLIEARVVLGDKGRFVIPVAIREAMGASEGDTLMLHMEGGELRVITRKAAMLRAQERVRRLVEPGRSLAGELIQERRAEALAESLE